MTEALLDQEVSIVAGRISGSARDPAGVLAYRGIPYAEPPVGELRWRRPRPVRPWQGIRPAEQFGARCPGASVLGLADDAVGESEDCLTLNVWTAATHANDRRPVMVWIHGGGFQFGSGAVPVNDGTALARAGAVVVSFHYRLGVFGFLAHHELDDEGSMSGNYGLSDMMAALAWVRDNIECFGGDPARVTIFGESAGAHAVGLLMASPPARGLFHRAIAQSGAWWDSEHGSIPLLMEARGRGARWIERHGGGSIAAARALPARILAGRATWNLLLDPMTTAFAPSVDGETVPDTPARVFARGEQSDVPLLAGWVAFEESVFGSRGLPTRASAFRRAAERRFGRNAVALNPALFPSESGAVRRASDRLTGDLVIAEQVHAMLGLHAQSAASGTWGYQFGHSSRFLPKAGHTLDVPFVFNTLLHQKQGVRQRPGPGPEDEALAELMLARWVAFASTGVPGPDWPRYTGAGGMVSHFGGDRSIAGPERDTDYMALIDGVRRGGRLPERWRSEGGRLSPRVAAVLRPPVMALIAASALLHRVRRRRARTGDGGDSSGGGGRSSRRETPTPRASRANPTERADCAADRSVSNSLSQT